MATRRSFIKNTGVLSAGVFLQPSGLFAAGSNQFESKRPPLAERKFSSDAVEATIVRIRKQIADPELAWLFGNCFPNTLDTTVEFEMINGKPDTYVITGDIDAMWLRDSTAQVWPYLPLVKEDKKLQALIAGVINRQKHCILLDPYANAFYKDENKESEWKSDITKMKPGIHERKWEIDSLCYPVRLAYNYWKITGDVSVFDAEWIRSIELTVQTFKEQQRKQGDGPYTFQRTTSWATDGVPLSGYGYPVNPVGLICSTFRPSDDSTLFQFLVPSNFFAVVSLRQAAEILGAIHSGSKLISECRALADEVEKALRQHAITIHPKYGRVYAFEVNGFGSYHLMDDANVPSLLSLPYLNAVKANDPVYANTRRYILSADNPFFFVGKAAEGIGGPHGGMNTVWPLGITMRGLTSGNPAEVKKCLRMLKATHAGTGFMHEAFHKDDPSKFTRKWFAWANTLFGEFVLHTHQRYPQLLAATL
ncbi:glycoside hydrolase family 125 protein [Flavihumibacter stibioxidans]|uniref:Metal-independent alpha-mannosidase n=1 Tax=Flavihumibacter stibioxidans TaxID=1834163 RepID=A0ABR7M6C7_9BACT|nr:glycoside hydrolase family 125 protein [Flavihumibacter stibioxidans]MBC6490517.1 metal-independent alpha-mannosidase [Flavihumibacter stibioxidans]